LLVQQVLKVTRVTQATLVQLALRESKASRVRLALKVLKGFREKQDLKDSRVTLD
jgi:hypothetical protein